MMNQSAGSDQMTHKEPRPRLLLVEDDLTLRQMLSNILKDEGYLVSEAVSKDEAFERIAEFPNISVAIVDLGLPPLPHTTTECLNVIRQMVAEYQEIKLIVLTGQDHEQAALEAIREGAFDFLSKPAQSKDIISAVNRATLFHRKERDMAADGVTRLQLNATVSDGLKAVREEAEEKLIKQVLKETRFNVYQSAARLGVKRESIYYFMKKFGISRTENESDNSRDNG